MQCFELNRAWSNKVTKRGNAFLKSGLHFLLLTHLLLLRQRNGVQLWSFSYQMPSLEQLLVETGLIGHAFTLFNYRSCQLTKILERLARTHI